MVVGFSYLVSCFLGIIYLKKLRQKMMTENQCLRHYHMNRFLPKKIKIVLWYYVTNQDPSLVFFFNLILFLSFYEENDKRMLEKNQLQDQP